jgi:ferrous iron transport protein A
MWERWRQQFNGCCCDRGGSKCLLSLSEARPGRPVQVMTIEGGRRLCGRMAALGIYPGVKLELLCNGCGAPCLVKVRGSTLSLGAGVSQKIKVAEAV